MGEIFKRSARLFARPSFLEGYGRVIDLGATLNEYNSNQTPEKADEEAILSDWSAVGDNIYSAINIFSREKEIV
jgi:hypothetical protein